MPNRLIHETSPYLRQHANNPVDWYPWGEEAFARARAEDKPVFLSIGYSACHWCHVMERESFEDQATAKLLNDNYVSVKVDREERPDVDSIYMQAVQMMTGHGGWPMSVFLTPDGAPFYGGTYYPPVDRHGMPSFQRVLGHLAELWRTRREDVAGASDELRRAIGNAMSGAAAPLELAIEHLDEAASHVAASFDPQWGGFGSAPKFPPSMSLDFLMQVARRRGDAHLRAVVTTTLDRMARGGIYDQIGGGFHRYSTDERWLVPHFEKMLYDNALLARLYTRAWQWTHEPLYARVVRETLGFVQRELMSAEGGFYSTLDADSEGVEGKFYVWSRGEILRALGAERSSIVCAAYDVTDRGNWEGTNILNVAEDLDAIARELSLSPEDLRRILNEARSALYAERERRVRPARDEKILAAWNGWMLAAFSEAAIAFGSADFQKVVASNADFLLDRMMVDGRLRRSWKDGHARIDAVLEDYAGVAWGLIAAFEAVQKMRYLEAAR
ncbi:MAG TPA: thioredoxin domain-containing protein, partial [Thermoanaerobaculia bacterium]